MEDFAYQLSLLTDKAYCVYTEPDVLDFTSIKQFRFVVLSQKLKISAVIDKENLPLLIGVLKQNLFSKDAIFLWYDQKSFNSYCLYHIKKIPDFKAFDLKVIESFCRIEKKKPENLLEAINRLKACTGWKSIYNQLHTHLINEVIPKIETTGLLNIETRQAEFPYYEIEGQQNGRLSAYKMFEKCFLPHTMSEETKQCLKPRNNEIFIYADIKSCEVKTLQWLTKDPILTNIVNSNLDIYKQMYELITTDECNSDHKRKLSKDMVLPVIYGCGAKTLTEILKLSLDECKDLISRTKRVFNHAFDWLDNIQYKAAEGKITDLFGRERDFTKEPYKARNFMVQGTAATVCQEKLVELSRNLKNFGKLCFTLYDGYGIVCPIKNVKETIQITKTTLETESKICAGLQYACEVFFGKDLFTIKPVNLGGK